MSNKPLKSDSNISDALQNSVNKIAPNAKVFRTDGGNKLSDVITEFAGPLLEQRIRYDEKEKIVFFSIIVWNLCLAPKKESQELIKKIHNEMSQGDIQTIKDMDEMMNYLIERKKRLYKDDKRFIVSYNITKIKDGMNLEVAYSALK